MYQVKDKILDIDIVEFIGKYVELKRAGSSYKGNCPLHGEKTPSFMVSRNRNIWKCFGCGKGGNHIDFVMENDGLSFMDAVKKIAGDYHIELPQQKEQTDEERKKEKRREALLVVNKIAANWFKKQLYENTNALDYTKKRWNEETIKMFDIGFAPDTWQGLLDAMTKEGVKKEILIEAGLIKEGKGGKLYDFFRGRIIIPIHDKYGRVIAFTGRDLPGIKNLTGKHEVPKYINSQETEIYKKGKGFFGLHLALKKMRDKGMTYLVEGNPDVIRLQEIGVENVVATSGTALTIDQVKLLKQYCRSVNIIGDTDKAGKNAIDRSARMLIGEGIAVNVVLLPEDDNKHDPDSFFSSREQFKDYVTGENIQDYILLKAGEWKNKANNPDFKSKAVDELSQLVVSFQDPVMHEFYIDRLGAIIKPKKVWVDKAKSLQKEKAPEEKGDRIPEHVKLSDFERFGFYEDHNSYFFRTSKGMVKGCNFTMKPLFHVQSTQNAKRLYVMKNEHGFTEVIELLQRDLVSLARFKERVESLGNFLWEASESELNKLKRFLYEKTETCIEITQLGWQKHGFFAWGNGIYNETFTKVDENGIVRHEDLNFYLPAFSSVYKHEDGLFTNERKFIHREKGDITLKDYMLRLQDVFGDNAVFAVSFYIASLFRDHIVRINNFFPILNLFGPKGAGKTELAVSILQFFGRQPKGPNINNTSKAALADHVAQVANACVHIDEYKNNIDFEKIEFLKGLWDGTGRTRMNMDKDKKKETTAVDCGIILSGQEMPTADIALFSRLVYLYFYKIEYSDKEKKAFNQLKELEKKGLTHITHELLKQRPYVLEHYRDHYDKVSQDLDKILDKEIIEDRIFRNWVVILAAYSTMAEVVDLPYTYKDILDLSCRQLRVQNRETKRGNEVSLFWNMVQYLYADGLIIEDVDYKIDLVVQELKTDMVDVVWDEPKDIIFIQHSRIIPLYRKHGKMQGEKVLPADSIDYYLRNDKRYLGKKRVAFKAIDPKTGVEVEIDGRKRRKITNAYAFLYKDLDILLNTEEDEEDPDPFSMPNKNEKDSVPY
jgi:DNA primase